MISRRGNGKRIGTHKLTLILTGLLMTLMIVTPVAASASSGTNSLTQLLNPKPSPLDEFGWSVAASEGLVLVGSIYPLGSPYPYFGGSAYLFNARTGALLFTLTSPNTNGGYTFGSSVSIGGGLLVVGAPGEVSAGPVVSGGNVYVFNATTGSLIYTLTSPNPQDGYFGRSVSVGDGLIAVGAPFETAAGLGFAGNVYVFNANSGGLLFSLSSPQLQRGNFGWSTSVGGGVIVIGAPSETSAGQYLPDGRVYAFDDRTGSLLFGLANPNPNPTVIYGGGEFGQSVAISGGLMVAGAPGDGALGIQPGPGSAYVFNVHTGRLMSTLTSPSQFTGGRFGDSVGVSSGIIVIGAPWEAAAGHTDAGTAYVFKAQTAHLLSVLNSPNPQPRAYFGWSTAVDDELSVVGTPFLAGNCFSIPCVPGSAYIFS